VSVACNQQPETKKATVDTASKKEFPIRGYFNNEENTKTDSGFIQSFFDRYPQLKNYSDDVKQFYGYRNFKYAWYQKAELSEQAYNLYNHLNNLDLEGVSTSIPYKNILDSLFGNDETSKKIVPDLEILLTAEYFFYADKVWTGMSKENTDKLAWFLPRKKLNLPYMMDSLLKESAANLFPDNYSIRQYNLLKKQLQKYRQLDSAVKWEILNLGARPLQNGDSSFTVLKLKRRLFQLGDLDSESESGLFDSQMEAAVKSFQKRNGMVTDGRAGPSFFREINQPPSAVIRKLITNMERARWLPVIRGHHYITINIPSFTLTAFDQDTVTFTMNVVVGKEVHQTVVFSGEIKYVVFSPYWNVPPSIMKKEILPALRKNPGYLKKHGMEWNGNAIRQKPGPSNSLGLVKFLFPNSYNIYLHDTPAKDLFNEPTRAFSHGCIRLADPKKLAVYLLKDDPSWTEQKIIRAMHAGKEKYVTLKNPVPVFIGYLTAWVDPYGKLNLRKDIYNRDKALGEMLFQ
jgi:murein L,D-transpeptidase YcbB/YkuD